MNPNYVHCGIIGCLYLDDSAKFDSEIVYTVFYMIIYHSVKFL